VLADELTTEFEEFVVASSPRLLRTAFLLCGDRGHAEDLLQSALLRTARRWRTARESPESYTRRVIVNLVKDGWRGASRRPRESLTGRHYEPTIAGHGDGLAERDALLRATSTLPSQQRAVLILRYFDDLSIEETATVLGCTSGTVKSHTHRALTSLRRLLADETIDSKELSHVER